MSDLPPEWDTFAAAWLATGIVGAIEEQQRQSREEQMAERILQRLEAIRGR